MNIIRNGGFESGTLSPGWRQTPGSATLDGGVTDATCQTGTYCLELRGLDFVEQAFFIARATGDLSFYAKTDSAVSAGPFYVRIEYIDGSEITHWVRPSNHWAAFSYSVDDSKRLLKIQFGTGETGSIYIDNVYLDGARRDPYIPDFHDPRLDRLLGLRYQWQHDPFYPEWIMSPAVTMEEPAIFDYDSVMEDRVVQIETQLAELSLLLSGKSDIKNPTKSKKIAKKKSRKVNPEQRE